MALFVLKGRTSWNYRGWIAVPLVIIIIIITGLATIVGVKSCSLKASAPYAVAG